MKDMVGVLLALSGQMYEDIKFIAQANPTQVVDDDTTRLFNNLLKELRKIFPAVTQVLAYEEMSPRTLKYKDALVVVGQMYHLLSLASRGELPMDFMIQAYGATGEIDSPLRPSSTANRRQNTPLPVESSVTQGTAASIASARTGQTPSPEGRTVPPPTKGFSFAPPSPQAAPPQSPLRPATPPAAQKSYSFDPDATNPPNVPLPLPGAVNPAGVMRRPVMPPPEDSLDIEDHRPPGSRGLSPHDEELYGPNVPLRVNDDGTVPFTLDDGDPGGRGFDRGGGRR